MVHPPCTRGGGGHPRFTVVAALRQHIGAYRARFASSPRKQRVLDWLCACQTAALGGRAVVCPHCGWTAAVYNSCCDRHCPQCRGGARKAWLLARQAQLLPVPHFQVVATLPGVLRPIAALNPELVFELLFHAAVEALQTLAADRLGATLGILAVLHTWTTDLRFHPHVHLLVTAGGLCFDDQAWVPTPRLDFLFPKRVLAPLFAARVAAGLRRALSRGELVVPGTVEHAKVTLDAAIRTAYQRRWFLHIEAPMGRPADHVAKYLARYVNGIAIANSRITAITPSTVSFDSRNGHVTLTGAEFVRRFALHILPKGFRRVRYFGLYATANVHTRWQQARALLHAPKPPPIAEVPRHTCPVCGHSTLDRGLPDLPFCRPRIPPRAQGPP